MNVLPRRSIRRDIAVLLAIKVLALTAIYVAFFAPAHRPAINPAAHIAGSSSTLGR
jgi:hypothetical protein